MDIGFLMRIYPAQHSHMKLGVVVSVLAVMTACAPIHSPIADGSLRGSPRFFAQLEGRESPFCGRIVNGGKSSVDEQPAKVVALIQLAGREQTEFGGQSIDEDGRLVHEGLAEAEFGTSALDQTPAWERVDGFWASVPGSDADARTIRIDAKRYVTLNKALKDNPEDGAARTSLLRAAAVDNPWSAAFISALEKGAGLNAVQFAFSAAHADYVTQAAATSDAEARGGAETFSAYRACPLTKAAPEPGDLLCATRSGRSKLDNYPALTEALSERTRFHAALAMHCELVVSVRPKAGYLEAIGGNVVQSVTRRRLALADDGSGLLNSRYVSAARRSRRCNGASPHSAPSGVGFSLPHLPAEAGVLRHIARTSLPANSSDDLPTSNALTSDHDPDVICPQPSLNDLSWVVLLQWRGRAR